MRNYNNLTPPPNILFDSTKFTPIILCMFLEIEKFAPAKINIGLKVLPKTENQDYHQIESIFQTVNLRDRLCVKVIGEYDSCCVTCSNMALPKKNTITCAYEAFREVSGLKRLLGVHVELEKKIPSGGGLGGGSSDAVAMIKALEEIHKIQLTDFQHEKIAEKVGSDVFFFFHCDKNGNACALVSGRGEIVNDIKSRSDLLFVLAFPKIHSSTKEAYKLVDDYYSSGKNDGIRYPDFWELKKIYNTSINRWNFVNSFTAPLSERYPEIGNALQCIRQSGALFSEMSGSGSTVFGIFDSSQNQKRSVDALISKGFSAAMAV